jgi:hypothetical protein
LIFILLSLDLSRVIYLGILLGLDSFRSPPSTRIHPFYLTQIQLYLFVESVLYKLDVLVYKKVSYPKQWSLLILLILVLPGLRTQVFTRSGNYLPDFLPGRLPDFYSRLCPIPYPSHYPKPYPSRYPSRTRLCYPELYLSPTRTRTRSVNLALPEHDPTG